jgi:hypothetical protein
MANLGNDGVGLIRSALLRPARMKVDVSNNSSSSSSAMIPEYAQASPVDLHDAGIQRTRIHVIVEDELLDSPRSTQGTKEECSALPPLT